MLDATKPPQRVTRTQPSGHYALVVAQDIETLLHESADRFVDGIAGMSEGQWLFKPASDAWCPSEVTEHLSIANRGIHGRLAKGLAILAGPRGVADDEIPYLFYRGDEPPNVSTPTGSWIEVDAAIAQFAASTETLVTWYAESDLDLRAYGAPHPVFGTLDALQWLLFAQAHIERHRAQVIGITQRPAFPPRT